MSDVIEELRRKLREERALSLSDTRLKITKLEIDLTVARKLHTTLKLRTRIEKLEDLMCPPEKYREDWQNVPKLEKWRTFSCNPETYFVYEDLILSILSIFDNDVDKSAKSMRHTRSKLF